MATFDEVGTLDEVATPKGRRQVIKLLIVDDSALMRKLLREIFAAQPDFETRVARNGLEALEMVAAAMPDVITLDVHMPGMDGLTLLDRIMVEHPCPVVMVSSLTAEDAEATLEALSLGAVDVIAKPGGAISLEIDRLAPLLVEKVRAAAGARPRPTLRLTERVRHSAGSLAARYGRANARQGPNANARQGPNADARQGLDATARQGLDATARLGLDATARQGPDANARQGLDATARQGPDATVRHGPEATARRGPDAKARQGLGMTARQGLGTTARRGLGVAAGLAHTVPDRSRDALTGEGMVLIGTSTGGPPALEALLTSLPADFPWPILIAQHMPASFTGTLARRLDGICALSVMEVTQTHPVRPGEVYIGRGDADLIVSVRRKELVAMAAPSAANYPWHPSADRLVRSAMAHVTASQLVGVLLTGMGNDGAAAMRDLHALGGKTIAEAKETSVVWGMPGELVALNGADWVVPLPAIGDCLRRLLC